MCNPPSLPTRSNYGFDPLGLAKDPASLSRFQESEVIHCRWAMLGVAGALAVELLGFGGPGGTPVPLHRDGLRLYSLDPDDLGAEIAGIAARLLCDWGGAVLLGAPDGRSVELRVTGDRLTATPSWPGGRALTWDSPIRLGAVGTEVSRLLGDELGVSSARGLTVVTSP